MHLTSNGSINYSNNKTSSKNLQMSASGKFATLKSTPNAGTSNVFVKTRPNTVVRADLIKNKTTKRTESVSSAGRAKKDDEYKAGKKPKPAFKTKLVNKYCTFYHKYGRRSLKFQDLRPWKKIIKKILYCVIYMYMYITLCF